MDAGADRETVRKKKSGSSEEWRNRLHPLISRDQATWNIVKLVLDLETVFVTLFVLSVSRKHLKNDRRSSTNVYTFGKRFPLVSNRYKAARSLSRFSTDRRSLGLLPKNNKQLRRQYRSHGSLPKGCARTFSRSPYRFRTCRQQQGGAAGKASKEKSNLKARNEIKKGRDHGRKEKFKGTFTSELTKRCRDKPLSSVTFHKEFRNKRRILMFGFFFFNCANAFFFQGSKNRSGESDNKKLV